MSRGFGSIGKLSAIGTAVGLVLLLCWGLAPEVSAAAGLAAAPAVVLTQVLSGFRQPVFVTHAGDGSNRLFVVENGGTIRVVSNGQVQSPPFLDLSRLVNSNGAEQGLLGLAFHPRYATNGLFFIAYTALDGANRVARYRVSADPNRADPASATVVLALPDPHPTHNIGMLAFGPDGYLYVGTGDGGGAGDPQGNGQNLQTLFGKLLRLDVDDLDSAEPYAVPPTNPFLGQSASRPEIWALGLRNPWRYSFDRATGDLYLADVGQALSEEVNLQRASSRGGENYGWNRMEGFHCYASTPCDQTGLTLPIAEYTHSQGDCSIIGGYVYRGTTVPALSGAYLYGDYCSGRIWALRQAAGGTWVSTQLLVSSLQISSFGEDQAGEIYITDLRGGSVYRVANADPPPSRPR